MCLYTGIIEQKKAKEDIKCYMVFYKKRLLNSLNIYKTIRRRTYFIVKREKTIVVKNPPKVAHDGSGLYITNGLYSYTRYKPVHDKSLIVWECRIPKNSIYYKNNFEYISDSIKFVKQLS